MRHLPIIEETEPVLVKVRNEEVLLLPAYLGEERSKEEKGEKGGDDLVPIRVRKTD